MNSQTWKNIAKISLVIFAYIYTLQVFSHTLDLDLGWHLRFGQDAAVGNFQYLDSYTWPHFGLPWVNHEWGGDLLFWFIYSHLGYCWLMAMLAACPLLSAIILIKSFAEKIKFTGFLLIPLFIYATKDFMTVRLAVIAPVFFALTVYSLERIARKKLYYFWPLLFWVWSALHGSWILGFITINIYLAANVAQPILAKWRPNWAGAGSGWRRDEIMSVLGFQVLSVLIIFLNPYGINLYKEVLSYFTEPYFKQTISEWLPSYSYPVLVAALSLGAAAAYLVVVGYRKKQVVLAQLLLFFAIFYSAWKYKRNDLYLALVSLPVLEHALSTIAEHVKKRAKMVVFYLAIILSCSGLLYLIPKIYWTDDIWHSNIVSRSPNLLPKEAAEFLRKESKGEKVYIFNEFKWGGYLIWTLPNALLYLDGRGPATWRESGNATTTLEEYQAIKYKPDGLSKLEKSPARYILMGKNRTLAFGAHDLNKIFFFQTQLNNMNSKMETELEKELNESNKWKLIYEDRLANIWRRL